MQYPGDLVKLKVPSRSVLRQRALDVSTKKNDYCKYAINHADPYSFFEEMTDACLILSSKGFNIVTQLFPGMKYDGEEAWVCWEEEIVNMVSPQECKYVNDVTSSKEESLMEFCTDRHRFNYAWRYRNYVKDLKKLNSYMNTAVDCYGYDSDISKSIGSQLYLQVRSFASIILFTFMFAHG